MLGSGVALLCVVTVVFWWGAVLFVRGGSAAGSVHGAETLFGCLGSSWMQLAACEVFVFLLPSLPGCAGRLQEAELFAPGVPAEAGQPWSCDAAGLAGAAFLGCLRPLLLQAGSVQVSQLTAVSQPHQPVLPSLWGHRAQGCATEVTKEGDSTLAGCPKSPKGDSGGFPRWIPRAQGELAQG